MNLGLRGRIALITGSSRGIGRATAEAFGAEGAGVTVTYRSNRAGAEETAEAVRSLGAEAIVTQLNLSDPNSIDRAVSVTMDRWGRLDILVNNAMAWPESGDAYTGPVENAPMAEWQRLMRANAEGPLLTIRSVVPAMREGGWGRIVSLSSVAVSDGMPGYSWYAASKSSLHGLTRTLAQELGPAGILINVVMAGATLTERVQAEVHSRLLTMRAARLPIRRIPAARDVADCIVFLCSERNIVITGEAVRASGGRSTV